jgi:hypothetical protein
MLRRMLEPSAAQPFRWYHALSLLVICGVYVALIDHFMPLAWLTSRTPIGGVDYETHAEQTFRVIEGLEGWGKSWVYDARFLAGFPNGTIFDADNKLWELWTYALYRLGLPAGTAFNTFVFLGHFLLLPLLYSSARVFGSSIGASILAMALGALLWVFDSYAHWFWWIGTLAYIFAAYFYILPLALFYRYSLDRKTWRLPCIALLMTLAHLLHPYSFFVMVAPMLVLYIGMFRSLERRQHLGIVAVAVCVVAGNAYWLIVAIQHWHYILNSAYYGQSHPGFVVADFFNVLVEAQTSGYLGTRTAFRWLSLTAAGAALYFWRRERDPRYRLFLISFIYMFALAYIGPVVYPDLGQIQPYRFVASAMFLATIPAAALIMSLASKLREAAAPVRAGVIVLAIPALQHLSSDVMYFLPEILPVVPKVKEAPFPISATGFAPHIGYRHLHPSLVDRRLEQWVDGVADEGRIAIPDWTGERMAWATRAQILGGFVELNMQHARAHLARWADYKHPTREELRSYLETYAVRYIVVRFDDMGLREHADLLEPFAQIAESTIYRSKLPVSFFYMNDGKVVAKTNRITVSGTDPGRDVVIKYHWHEALVCKPNCRVIKVEHVRDEVGFIRVPIPHPPDFVIENSYEMGRR